jgi:putative ABC transport system permease protein
MYVKLSLRNVRRSYKDYAVYFLTIIVAVSLFYTFNALSQTDVLGKMMNSKQSDFTTAINLVMSVLSVFVSLILGFLLIYANNFLIRRRKKEMGIYLTLGMSKQTLSAVLFLETCSIGLISLVIGLPIGVLLSQGFAVLIQQLALGNTGTAIHFFFSPAACLKTIFYFASMFLCVMIFNIVVIRRYQVIQLIRGGRHNQTIRRWPAAVYLIVFAAGIAMIGRGYWLVGHYGLQAVSKQLWLAIILGSVGTFCFFFALAGFALKLFQLNKKLYFHHLNMFVLRQISSKMNTAWVSTSFVTLMLFFAFSGLIIGVNISQGLNRSIGKFAVYDASIHGRGTVSDLEQTLRTKGIDLGNDSQRSQAATFYRSPLVLGDLLPYVDRSKRQAVSQLYPKQTPIPAITQSAYNRLMKLQGKQTIHLSRQGWLLITPDSGFADHIARVSAINVNGQKVIFADHGKTHTAMIENAVSYRSILTIVVPDRTVRAMQPLSSLINIDFKGNKSGQIAALRQKAKALEDPAAETTIMTSAYIADLVVGNNLMVNFSILYLALIFLIAGCAILALQQLAESSDNVLRYGVLKQLGAGRRMIHHALLAQIALSFFIPLCVALIHSSAALKVMDTQNRNLSSAASIWQTASIVVPLLLLIYLAYFSVTYYHSRAMIDQQARRE